eukprot:4992389-Amphidinium_carterae.4
MLRKDTSEKLEDFALESGYLKYALYAALDMYSGRRRVLAQGTVTQPVAATHGMPTAYGHVLDLLRAFLLKTLQSAGRQVTVRKYVKDMVLGTKRCNFAGNLCYGYRQVHKSLSDANMKANPKITVVICNGAKAKYPHEGLEGWQWAAWRCPVQKKRVLTFRQSTAKVDDRSRSAVNAALGGIWHEFRTHSAFDVGELCVRCGEEAELSHIIFRHKERRRVELAADDDETPTCVKLRPEACATSTGGHFA